MKVSAFPTLRSVLAAFLWLALGASFVAAQATLPAARVGVAYAFQVTTTPAAPAGTIYAATSLPTGLSINTSSGAITGIPAVAGTATGAISLTSGGVTNSFTYTLRVDPPAGTPAITSAATASATVGVAFAYTVTGSNAPASFNVGALPAGLTFTSPTIGGTPTTAGTYQIPLSANNALGTGATTTLTLTVNPAGPVPAITSAATATAALNVPFTYSITASNSPLAFSAVGLPFGLVLNTTTGVISGTPTIAGVYTVGLSATNNNGTGATTNLSLTLGSLSIITSSTTLAVTANQAMTPFTLLGTNSPQSFNVTGLPPGLSVNTATGVISGTPTTVGNFTVTVSANNATGTGPGSTLALSVAAATGGGSGGGGGSSGGGSAGGGGTVATAPVITLQPVGQSVTEGASVTFSVGTAGTAPIAYQWSKDGVSIAGATGASLALPAVTLASAGTYRVVATNSAGSVASDTATLVVTALVTPPVIATQPASQTIAAGAVASLGVVATGTGPLTYQWFKDGAPVDGATAATLTIANASASATGSYSVTVSNRAGTVSSSPAVLVVVPPVARLINLSTRGVVGTGERILVAGFVVTGDQSKAVMIRAVGPGLGAFGVPGVLADPGLELFGATGSLAASDNWSAGGNALQIAGTAARVGAFALTTGSNDAVILATLQPGAYTAHVRGANNGTGVGLVEIYDASETTAGAQLVNVATRGDIGTGANVLIAGFVIAGDRPKQVLIRGAGPSLLPFGVTTAIADPRVQLFRGATAVEENDNWGAGAAPAAIAAAAAQVGAFAFESGSKDAALLLTLAPGDYSVHVSGAAGAIGTGLVEIYEVP